MTTFTARPTLYRGIRMRSRLEATYAALLDNNQLDWDYEPECFADHTGQYLPDFLITIPGDFRYYIDVKPAPLIEHDIRERMERIWSSRPDCALAVWTPDGDWHDFTIIGAAGEWWQPIDFQDGPATWITATELRELHDTPDYQTLRDTLINRPTIGAIRDRASRS